MKCEDCKFCSKMDMCSGGEQLGLCRRFPPILVITDEDPIDSWPRVNMNSDWCGELQPKKV